MVFKRSTCFFLFILLIFIVGMILIFMLPSNAKNNAKNNDENNIYNNFHENYKKIKIKNTPWTLERSGLKYPLLGFINNVLTKNECSELIKIGEKIVEKSIVGFDIQTDSKVRNSSHAWISQNENPICKRISQYLVHLTGIPASHQEDFQIVSYEPGQYYHYHLDSCNPAAEDYQACLDNGKTNGFRIYTFIIYLNEDYEGGTTHFKVLDQHVKGKTGQAIYFKNLLENSNESDHTSLHSGTEVKKGRKWITNCWIRTQPYVS